MVPLTYLSSTSLLMIDYVASTATGHSAEKAIERKDKRPLPFPVGVSLVLYRRPAYRAVTLSSAFGDIGPLRFDITVPPPVSI